MLATDKMGKKGFQIGATDAADIELWVLQSAQQRMLGLVEEVEALDPVTIDLFGAVSLSRLRLPAEKSLSAERNLR